MGKLDRIRLSLVIGMLAYVAFLTPVIAATYQVRFDATWNETDFPDAFPGTAHFSPLVGGTHNADISFWEPGGLASAGIESMAETGATGTLLAEINTAIADGTAADSFTGGSLFNLPRSTTLTIDVLESHPLVTLTTMIAPSPDWFIGVHGLPLRENDQWLGEVVVDLLPYDAGTEEGTGFSTGNPASSPHQPITMINSDPFPGAPSLGTFTFTVQPNGLAGDFDLNGVVNELDGAIWQSNLDAYPEGGASVVDGDADGDGRVDGADLLAMQRNFGAALPEPSAASSAAAVPEPATVVLVVLGGIVAMLLRRSMIKTAA